MQVLRKEVGLEIEDRIRLRHGPPPVELGDAMAEHMEYMKAELLCVDVARAEPGDDWHELNVRGHRVFVHIEKATPTNKDVS